MLQQCKGKRSQAPHLYRDAAAQFWATCDRLQYISLINQTVTNSVIGYVQIRTEAPGLFRWRGQTLRISKGMNKMKKGYYGQWGGAFIPEVLQATFDALNRAYENARQDASF